MIKLFHPTAAAPLLDRIDQGRVLGDLSIFFGPRAEAYLHHYAKFRDGAGWRRMFPLGWSWPSLVFSYAWFFYRKLYVAGALMVLLPIALGALNHAAGALSYLAFVVLAKTIYLHRALAALIAVDEQGLQGEARVQYLERAGGISWRAGGVAGAVHGATLGLLIFQIIAQP